ncbi:alpha/beta fold hydrolase [Paenibacillus pasadenensis]|uniref:alpha/beta fold hydrolase n=1 Tax=Paenibacillus pasadenensis TaxID=217090 RepID=UPI002041D89B|nr:alpha/beta fold hydrolase [Paenibacillus pasadenensis]MCM3748871.1 alpha/beta fold hydrolase [Paenibacillus pasadenensis]
MKQNTTIRKNRERRELTVERIVGLPARLAWEGWTEPGHIAKWWGPNNWTTTVYEMDVRSGGVWRYSLKADDNSGEEAYCRAIYEEVAAPSKLVYTDTFADSEWNIVSDSEMYTTVLFEETSGGTRISIVTRFTTNEQLDNAEAMGMIEGFTDAFDRLEKYLQTLMGGNDTMKNVISKDGTQIAYTTQGSGPALVLVSSAAADHGDASALAEHLSASFTVYNYDRRGRGQSTDTAPYKAAREAEDIEALIAAAGGKAVLFGSSSGAVLALEAATLLGDLVVKLYLYEPPFIINDSRKPVPSDYVEQLNSLIEAGKSSEAVEYFASEALGIPGEYIGYMKADPSWSKMEALAHTLAYDGTIMGTTQSGNPLPAGRWNIPHPTLIMTGENSAPFFHDAANALASLLPNAATHSLAGQDHSAIIMSPDVVAKAVVDFERRGE